MKYIILIYLCCSIGFCQNSIAKDLGIGEWLSRQDINNSTQSLDTIKIFEYGNVLVGSNDNYFYCVDALSGEIKWKFKTDAWVWSSPTIYQSSKAQ
jgi:outer membrane protein assembly factor BamB